MAPARPNGRLRRSISRFGSVALQSLGTSGQFVSPVCPKDAIKQLMLHGDKELSCNYMELLARSERFELPTLRFEV